MQVNIYLIAAVGLYLLCDILGKIVLLRWMKTMMKWNKNQGDFSMKLSNNIKFLLETQSGILEREKKRLEP